MKMRTRALWVTLVMLAGCGTDPTVEVKHRVPHGATIAVVMFQDCAIAGQADCDGSGASAGAIFARTLALKPGVHTVALPRPVGPKVPYSDDAAVAYARAKNYRYVINGEVTDYYRAGHITLHSDRAGVSVRVLNTNNGQAVLTFTYQKSSTTNFTTPDAILEDMAKQLADSVIEEPKKLHQGNYLIGQ